jgi:hypothetical protein
LVEPKAWLDAVDSTDGLTVVADSSLAVVVRVVVDSTPVAVVVDSMPVVAERLVVEQLVVEQLVAVDSSPVAVAVVGLVVALVLERAVLAVQVDSMVFELVQRAAEERLLCSLKRKP